MSSKITYYSIHLRKITIPTPQPDTAQLTRTATRPTRTPEKGVFWEHVFLSHSDRHDHPLPVHFLALWPRARYF